ncbi:putative urease accessory protein ureG [Phytophthora cinnamomi]|uniref:putative urease accessory protein ureG n=1 Tax=Phytophthora cinnamomi TaxID=4785 RepID=UPI003559F8D6|nr:putative urease accessory protein ureG [Phytophthora cinnamomi]
MVSEELAPLEAHVQAQVKHLSAVAGVVRELQSVEKQYADGYAALPLALPADAQSIIVGLPQLQRVTEGFSQFVHKSSVVKATVVEDLSTQVIAPLEAFIAEHVEKSQHLLSELYELLQKEKAFDVAYQNLLETCEMDRNAEPAKDNSTDSESVEAEVQLHRAHMEQLLRKRDAERLAIQQWITALHFAGQRYEAHVRNVVQQVIAVYDRMVAALTMLAGEYQGCAANRTYSTIRLSGDNNSTSSTASEEGWASFVAGYECHVTITSWMSELFKQLIPTEQKFAKDMKKATKLDRSLCKTFSDVGFSAQFAGFVQFHGLLTMNISNPIMRTLKFSKERQERMRNELVKSLEETRAHIDVARARLNARLAKEKENVEETPVRCDSMTSSETSECSVDDNNEEDLKETEVAIEEEVSTEPTPEQINLETLERKLVLQRQEMTHVFEQTSYLSVKTLELMVQDHLKHVIKALGTLKETMQAEFPDARCEKSNTAPQPWYHITERLAITL